MMTLRRSTLLLIPSAVLFAGACDLGDKSIGGDTNDLGDSGDGDGDGNSGDGDGDDGTEQPAGEECGEETVTVIEDPLAALPGFEGVVADYLLLIEGSFAGEFSWYPEDGPVTVAHAGTESPLSVTVSYDGGEIRLTEVENLGEVPNDGVFACSNSVQIDVTFSFVTEDGLFAESFVLPVTVSSSTEEGAELPSFYQHLDLDQFEGALALSDFAVDDGVISDLVLQGSFDGETVDGGLWLEFESMDWVAFGIIAEFSAAAAP